MAAGVKVIPSTVVFDETEMAVVFERANVAVSAEVLGTVAGVQLAAVFQSPEAGLRSHSALPAWAIAEVKSIRLLPTNTAINLFVELILGFVIDAKDYQAAVKIPAHFLKPNNPRASIFGEW